MKVLVQMNRQLGVILALVGFLIIVIMGLINDNDTLMITKRAITAMLIGYVTGRVVGSLGERLVKEAVPELEKRASEAITAESVKKLVGRDQERTEQIMETPTGEASEAEGEQ